MNAPKVSGIDYIRFLIGSPKIVTGTEAERCQPAQHNPPAHDAFTRLTADTASLDNLKTVDSFDWTFVTRFKSNRKVRLDNGPKLALHKQPIAEDGTIVDLPGFGRVRLFRIVAQDGTMTHWASNDLGLEPMDRLKFAELSWSIEEYHRGLKQFTGVSGCQCRSEQSQRNHFGFALRSLVRLEYHRFNKV